MTFSTRQLVAALTVIVVAFVLGIIAKEASTYLIAVGLVGGAAVLYSGSGGLFRGLTDLSDAIARASRGDRPPTPHQSPPQLAAVYESLGQVADRIRAEQNEATQRAETLVTIQDAVRGARDGTRAAIPSGVSSEVRHVLEQVDGLAASVAHLREQDAARSAQLRASTHALEEQRRKLEETMHRRAQLLNEMVGPMREVATSLQVIGQHAELLTASASESSASMIEMTSTSDEVTESVLELASSVRETASSIEEMAYSIKEVAKNVDALALTAEETSSSMNEMDVSIDQVQSNANETARLSEEVAEDAERGAEAILKTIGEIYRIKESTQEAVSVISNLGSRIEAIGQILNVIDDVAEQTNLLALNAAIIAAQAGEHGKGFAVVADEIKDLAERAGASTKEIADLTKTIQNESKNAIAAVERGAKNVDRGVEVSNDAERALKKILESSQKSTNMVRAIARATVEQAKGSRQVTDAIGRIAENVQQIAAATAEQARGSELIMKSAEKMRAITQNVERSSQDQSRGGRQVSQAIENIAGVVSQISQVHGSLRRGSEVLLTSTSRLGDSIRDEQALLHQLGDAATRLRDGTHT